MRLRGRQGARRHRKEIDRRDVSMSSSHNHHQRSGGAGSTSATGDVMKPSPKCGGALPRMARTAEKLPHLLRFSDVRRGDDARRRSTRRCRGNRSHSRTRKASSHCSTASSMDRRNRADSNADRNMRANRRGDDRAAPLLCDARDATKSRGCCGDDRRDGAGQHQLGEQRPTAAPALLDRP